MRKLLAILFSLLFLMCIGSVVDIVVSAITDEDHSNILHLPVAPEASVAAIILGFLFLLLMLYFNDAEERWHYRIYDLDGELVYNSKIVQPKGYKRRKSAQKAALNTLEIEMMMPEQHLILIDN